MGLGCDTATTITSRKAQTLVDGGYTFVCRYLGGSFKITSAEKKIILDAGLRIVSIWESGSPTGISYFTAEKDAKMRKMQLPQLTRSDSRVGHQYTLLWIMMRRIPI